MKHVSIQWILCMMLLLFSFAEASGQQRILKGQVISTDDNSPLPGVNVKVKGTQTGTLTDFEGQYSLNVTNESILVFSYIGFKTQEVKVGTASVMDIGLELDVTALDEIVVVGYGEQKKESVVGAITNATAEEINRTGGVTSLSNALTGLLPGVATISTTGEPGANASSILIRGQSTWNGGGPLILVNGVERDMNDIDPSEVESISVLKDASATAVFGVKGANGVILITTKRGAEGKPELTFSANASVKQISKIPEVLGSYQALALRNRAVENQVVINENTWGFYTPTEILEHYRLQDLPEIYPDVNWSDYMTEDYAMSHRMNMNVTGGTKFVKYFASLAYTHDGDVLATTDFGQGYDPEFSYDRFNFRSNLDFQVTPSTIFTADISGYLGMKKSSAGNGDTFWKGVYEAPPDLFPVQYTDGTFAQSPVDDRYQNSVAAINYGGYNVQNRTSVMADLKLNQKLDFITKGLSFNGRFSYDTYLETSGQDINDFGTLLKYIDPSIVDAQTAEDSLAAITYLNQGQGTTGYNYVPVPYQVNPERFVELNNDNDLNKTRYQLFYQASVNYSRKFGKHNVTGLALFNRQESATGSNFPSYREDWVGRLTYNFNDRYFAEFNGAYNGSEKFSKEYRFGFFPSYAFGWLVSNEQFFQPVAKVMNHLKFRYSDGKVGSDQGVARWLYQSSWVQGGNMNFGYPYLQNSFDIYREDIIANPDATWETAHKQNIGIETGFFNDFLSINLDYFWEHRTGIFMDGRERNVPVFFGAAPVAANLGETKTHGWELELNINHVTDFGLHYWAKTSYNFAKDEILYMEDPELAYDYQKREGYQINQTRTQLTDDFIDSWDEMYTGVMGTNNTEALPGDFRIVDYNADGVIDTYDAVPFGYPSRPQYTYNFSLGGDYKGFSLMLQFYGAHNVSRKINMGEYNLGYSIVRPFHYYDSWTPQTAGTATYPHIRYNSGSPKGDYWIKDASYLRLNTAELAYTFSSEYLKKLGITKTKIFLNGNNLFLWTNMIEDREGGDYGRENYPMVKRYNLGMNINF
ncbi:TonB-dependent receptor [Limibacter armeniacum]|uniref:SusC/RagA family TonB-linked outer membrane protein n=1 Tax=Limibacter armeniacum TaxID=466084 RepID=UPI002FE6C32C